MPIPTHQVHNVLTAYARRLHHRRLTARGGNTAGTEALGERRRALIQRMTNHYIEKTIRQHADQPQRALLSREPVAEAQLIYHELDACREKTLRRLGPCSESAANGGDRASVGQPMPG